MARRDLTGAVDFAYLEGYAGGDAGVVDEVLGLFQEQARMWLRLLDPAADAGGWKDAAHTLKGSALGIGAHARAETCAAAEAAGTADLIERTLRLDYETFTNASFFKRRLAISRPTGTNRRCAR